MSEVAFGSDGDFSDKEMVLKVNNVLANELGNLCQRTLSMVFKNCGKQVPAPTTGFVEQDLDLLRQASMVRETAGSAIAEQAIHSHNGEIFAKNTEQGLLVTILVPIA